MYPTYLWRWAPLTFSGLLISSSGSAFNLGRRPGIGRRPEIAQLLARGKLETVLDVPQCPLS